MLEAHWKDPFFQQVAEGIAVGTESLFCDGDNGVLRCGAQRDGAWQVLIPKEMRERVLRLEQEATLAGHLGEPRMYVAMRPYYLLGGMAADVVSYIRACASCATGRVQPLHRMTALELVPVTTPFQDVATDPFCPVDKTAAGKENIIAITNRITKMVRAMRMGRVHAIHCASVFVDYWIAACGPPDRILSVWGS